MVNEPIDLAAVLAKIIGSSRGPEMAMRLHQSLEMTDGLWELVPVVVAASEAHGQRSPAEVADSLPVAMAVSPERRARLRELGDTLSDITAIQRQPVDEAALENITAADIIADPFGIAGRLADFPAYLADVQSRLGPAGFLAELASMSPEEGAQTGAAGWGYRAFRCAAARRR
jgi:hypothetical protein